MAPEKESQIINEKCRGCLAVGLGTHYFRGRPTSIQYIGK